MVERKRSKDCSTTLLTRQSVHAGELFLVTLLTVKIRDSERSTPLRDRSRPVTVDTSESRK